MSEVRLKVGGRIYTVAVADGQEDALRALADKVDAKIAGMGKKISTNEAKNLLFAAILLADELEEATRGANAHATSTIDLGILADRLDAIGDALEKAADALESAG